MAAAQVDTYPEYFQSALKTISLADLREEIIAEEIDPPQRFAPYSYALGFNVFPCVHASAAPIVDSLPLEDNACAFGRIIFLYDPEGQETWNGTLRVVIYIESDLEPVMAHDPLLPQVGWNWVEEMLEDVPHTALGGTVTCTSSYRHGDIAGPSQAYQLEIRSSWTAQDTDLNAHVTAFRSVIEHAAGLPPPGVSYIGKPH